MSSSRRYAIATLSLGSCEIHRLEDKLRAAATAGFAAVELFLPDWLKYVELYVLERGLADSPKAHLKAARDLRHLLDSLHLRVNCLQPLRGIEGITDPLKRQAAFDQAQAYFPICNALDTDLILCCSNIEPSSSNDVGTMSKDLVQLADMARDWHTQHGGKLIKIGYEGLAWGVHVNTWRGAWEVVNHEPRPNLGLIIDSFNAMAREYANPYSASGLQRGPVQSAAFLKRHLAELMATVPGDKICLFQIADAGLPAPSSPASTPPSLESGIPRLQPWSRNCRLFPLETERGAFLPVAQYAAAVLQSGYSGDLSLEVFNASLSETGTQVPIEHAERGYCALEKLDASLRNKDTMDMAYTDSTQDQLTAKLHTALYSRSTTPQRPTAVVQY